MKVLSFSQQVKNYPTTRFMGSKQKLLGHIYQIASQFEFNTVLDLFSGSGVVSYMFKCQGKSVISNDYMAMAAIYTKAMVENSFITLPLDEAKALLLKQSTIKSRHFKHVATNLQQEIESNYQAPSQDHQDAINKHQRLPMQNDVNSKQIKIALAKHSLVQSEDFVATTFKGLYFTDEENELIDTLRVNIACIEDQYKHAIAMAALIRACIKKRPRGIFTYTGYRYDDGRIDLQKTLSEHFIEAVEAINKAVFYNGQCNYSIQGEAMSVNLKNLWQPCKQEYPNQSGLITQPELVYIDPPYYSPHSDNHYVRRYHFVEGLARDWQGVDIQEHTTTKKFASYPTPFASRTGAPAAFDELFKKYQESTLLVSYSSNSLPSKEDMLDLLSKHKQHVEVVPIDYQYSIGNQGKAKSHHNQVQEYLFIGY